MYKLIHNMKVEIGDKIMEFATLTEIDNYLGEMAKRMNSKIIGSESNRKYTIIAFSNDEEVAVSVLIDGKWTPFDNAKEELDGSYDDDFCADDYYTEEELDEIEKYCSK